MGDCFSPICGKIYQIPTCPQIVRDKLDDRGLIIDDENTALFG